MVIEISGTTRKKYEIIGNFDNYGHLWNETSAWEVKTLISPSVGSK